MDIRNVFHYDLHSILCLPENQKGHLLLISNMRDYFFSASVSLYIVIGRTDN